MTTNVFLTHIQLANRWGISERTLELWEDQGKIKASRFTPRMKRYSLDDVLEVEYQAKIRRKKKPCASEQ